MARQTFINTPVNKVLKERIQKCAKQLGINNATLMRMAVKQFIDNFAQQQGNLIDYTTPEGERRRIVEIAKELAEEYQRSSPELVPEMMEISQKFK